MGKQALTITRSFNAFNNTSNTKNIYIDNYRLKAYLFKHGHELFKIIDLKKHKIRIIYCY